MTQFERRGTPMLDGNGKTVNTSISLSNGAKIRIIGGDRAKHFRLKFDNNEGDGWWLDMISLDELIAELLYIREEVHCYSTSNVAFDLGPPPDAPDIVDETF